jgi:hypothetical protein
MATLTRQLHERIRGDNTENKDWWRLVFDTEAKHFYMEPYGRVASRPFKQWDCGVRYQRFLAEGEAPAQAELLRIVESVFEKGGGEWQFTVGLRMRASLTRSTCYRRTPAQVIEARTELS